MSAAKAFALIADALTTLAEEKGFGVYVSTNSYSITLTEKGYVGGGEMDVKLKVRTKSRGGSL